MASQAQRITDALTRKVEGVCRMLALEIAAELKRMPPAGTPVDTGHARRNWIPSVGVPNTSIATDDTASAQGIAAVLAYKLESGSLWVANVVPYIRALNYGHSTQAPPGFVERAIDNAMAKVQQKGGDVSAMRSQFQNEVGGSAAGNVASAYSPFGGDDD